MTANEKKIAQALKLGADWDAKRRWNCLNEGQIAAYADRQVPENQKDSIEAHLADCNYCLSQLAFLVKTGNAKLPEEVPAYLVSRGVQVVEERKKNRSGFGWQWKAAISVAAAAACVLIVSVVTLREPAPPATRSTPAVTREAPTEGNATPPSREPANALRSAPSRTLLPTLRFPRRGATITRNSLEFRWDAVPGARYYDVSVANADGDVIWSTQADRNLAKAPAGANLPPGGPYFVTVLAHFSQGETVRSESVAFAISAQP